MVNLLLVTIEVVACSMQQLYTVFFSLPVEMFGSVLLSPLSFLLFFNITWWEFCFCGFFVVGLVALVLVTNAMFSLGLLDLLVFVAHAFDFG